MAVAWLWWIAPAVDAEVQLLLAMLIRGPSSSSSFSPAGLVKKQELLADGAASVVVVASPAGSGRRRGREADGQQVLVPLPLPLALGSLARGQAAVHRPIAAEVALVLVLVLVLVILLDMGAPRRRGSRDELGQLLRRRLAAVEVDAAMLGQRLLRLLQHGLQVLALRFDPQLQVSLNLRAPSMENEKCEQAESGGNGPEPS